MATDLSVEKQSVGQLLPVMITEFLERFLQDRIMALVSLEKSIFRAM
ncbi:hypothetical protein [Corynebacterium diphtheriae]|nr:hypothetical protein [Corynebacterium diphtheriae]MBG9270433.1 hypothetical protein [Corynebacterium diphtheriae bv. gravis]MCS6572351.1 hypothetical protein [Corynebacterium diphtheriae]